jgi:hypothetical protein
MGRNHTLLAEMSAGIAPVADKTSRGGTKVPDMKAAFD